MKKYEARLIGETSAGMTAVEIYKNEDLVWSHYYFTNGATYKGYIDGLCQAVDDMINLDSVDEYEGCDQDEDGNVIQYDDSTTTGVIASYTSAGGWDVSDDFRRYGRSHEIIDALMVAGIVPEDEDHEDAINDTIEKIAKYVLLPE